MKLLNTHRRRPKFHPACRSRIDWPDRNHTERRQLRMRREFRAVPSEWRPIYIAGLSKQDTEAITGRTHRCRLRCLHEAMAQSQG